MFNPDWFQTVTSIDYGKDEENHLKPIIKDDYSVGGQTVTGYGEIRFELYRDAELTQKVSRNAEGHYEVNADPDQEYATYYMGITSSGGKNVEAQENPVRIGTDLKIYRAQNTISIVTCPDIRYGEAPKPELTAADTTGEIKYIYSSNEDGEYKEWNAENKPGLWYVKATVSQSQNYKKAESTPVAFTVSKAQLVPSVNMFQSKTYDGGTKAEGTLTLSSADGNPILSEDAAGLEAKGTFNGHPRTLEQTL